jgi:hypothetical protein
VDIDSRLNAIAASSTLREFMRKGLREVLVCVVSKIVCLCVGGCGCYQRYISKFHENLSL